MDNKRILPEIKGKTIIVAEGLWDALIISQALNELRDFYDPIESAKERPEERILPNVVLRVEGPSD